MTTNFQLPLNQIIHGDSLDILAQLPKHSVDLVFADPPYNLQLQQDLWRPNMTQVNAVNDAWDKFENIAAYDRFTQTWLRLVHNVMKPHASIWVSGTYHNIYRVGRLMQDLGFWLLNTVTWLKPNAMPNFRGMRLKNDVEFIIWATRSPRTGYIFNHHQMKQFNTGKQLGSVWTIPHCGGDERLRDADGKKLHPTQKPEELLRRIIVASSIPGHVVLDPFMGTGTTAAVAIELNRQWLGIERDIVYVEAAQRRIAKVQPLDPTDPLLTYDTPRRGQRVAFKVLVKHNWLKPGDLLYLDHPQYTAEILQEGLLRVNGQIASIHRMAAILKDVPSSNGWLHWLYVDENGVRVPIDRLRVSFRETRNRKQE
jgi:DNA modification methylase